MPRQTPSTGRVAVAQHLAPDREVGGDVGVAGAGREHARGCAAARPRAVDLVVLDDRGSRPVTAATRCTRFHV